VRAGHITLKGWLFFAPLILVLIKTEFSQRTAMPSSEEQYY